MTITTPDTVGEGRRGLAATRRGASDSPSVSVDVSTKALLGFLVLSAAAVLSAHGLIMIAKHAFGFVWLLGLIRLFHLGEEWNVPTIYSCFLLLTCAGTIFLIGALVKENANRFLWFFLGVIFIFLSMDELFTLHERLTMPIRNSLGADGVFHFSWIIPYSILVLALAVVYFRWLFSLPAVVRNLMIASAIMYLSGAVGVEMLEGLYASANTAANTTEAFVRDLNFELLVTVEETLEIAGLITFIYALLRYISDRHDGVTVRIATR